MNYDPDEALKLKNQLCFPLYAAARKVTGAYTPLLKPLGLTYTQYLVLLVLWEEDGQQVSAICEKLFLDSGTLTPLLKKMEAQGIVARERSARDERCVIISLTQKGRDLKAKAAMIPQKAGACVGICPEDGAELYRLLYRILGTDTKPEQ